MAKRIAPSQEKLFSFDLESLLISDLSQEEQQDSQTFSSELFNHPKKQKTKNSKSPPAEKITEDSNEPDDQQKEEDEEIEEGSDVANFFKIVGNDFSKSMQLRKSKLGQFTETIISACQSKFTDMIKKQDAEIEAFREQTLSQIEEELKKYETEFQKMRQQESKLLKILEQQMKIIQKSSAAQTEWIENFRKLHKNFIQAYAEMQAKHKNEILELKKSLAAEMSDLQNKFLMESKKEEMQTMKKYLSSVYF